MDTKLLRIFTAAAAMAGLAPFAFSQEAGEAAAEEPSNPEMEAEIAYIEALIDNAYSDIAEPVIESVKKRWPESEAKLFAINVRSLLSMGKFAEAEKMIAALPDRKSSKYWAARLEVANNYFARSQREECMKIYDEFFKAFATPPKDLKEFYINASYAYGKLLYNDRNYEKAASVYDGLLKQVSGETWCNLAAETAKLHLALAEKEKTDKKKRDARLAAAEKIVDKLLWKPDQPVYFGQAVSMKSHIAEMRGDFARAQSTLEDFRAQLVDIHSQIVQADPEGKLGLLSLSPYPECMFLQAKMLWTEAQNEFKKPKRDDERVKGLLFGPKGRDGRRDKSKGAFTMAVTVFLKYDFSPWAPQAGEMSEEIREFAEKNYKAKIKTHITREQIEKARAAQFKSADEKFARGMYAEAVDEYYAALAKYPEIHDSIRAVANIAHALLDLVVEDRDAARKEEYRIDADAVEGYIAERFADNPDNVIMTDAGNATIALAAKEKERGQAARADRLYMEFVSNYRRHVNAPTLAASLAGEHQKAGRYEDAIRYWGVVETCYTNSRSFFAPALSQLAYCYGKLGDGASEIKYLKRYLEVEKAPLRRLQAQMQLAQKYKNDGFDILRSADTNATPEAVAAAETRGSAQIIRALQQFTGFSAEAEKAIKSGTTPLEEVGRFSEMRENAMFLVADCWGRLNKPAAKVNAFRERSAEGYESYLRAYPDGRFSTNAYMRLGTIYTALGNLEKSKDALDRLSAKFPDSPEAKNAKPRLAKNLIDMGMKREGAEIYAEMLRTADGAYTARQFLNAGDALIEARSWDLANQAFEKAIRLAGTNQVSVVANARLGQARCSIRQGRLAEAREALDLFVEDPKMSKMTIAADAHFMLVDVASEQGRTEKDSAARGKHFGAAISSLNKVRSYWAKRQRWELDSLELLAGDVLVRRMKAEEAMDLKAEAMETCGKAAAKFQVFLQSRGVAEGRPFDKMAPEEQANLERCYAAMVPLFAKMGAEQADRVMKFGQEYLDLFPGGKARTEIENCMNQAKADMPKAGAEGAAPAAAPSAEEGKEG